MNGILLYYKIRIDSTDKVLLRSLTEKYATNYLICFENFGTDNPHSHYYIESIESHTTIRAFIRKTFGAGNGVYSLKVMKEWRPVEYLAYLVKEGEYESFGIDLTAALAYDDKVKQEMKEKRDAKKTHTVFNDLENDYLTSSAFVQVENSFPKEWMYLYMFIIEWHISRDKMIQEFRIKSYAQTIACKHHNYASSMAHRMLDHGL